MGQAMEELKVIINILVYRVDLKENTFQENLSYRSTFWYSPHYRGTDRLKVFFVF